MTFVPLCFQRFDCPAVSEHGGPVLSSEITEVKGQLPIVWTPLLTPGLKYQLYVSGMQYGEEVSYGRA